jgi:large subunit ribosomal protein L15
MELISLKNKSKKRPGRGISAGQGKTAGRGTKGQKSRSGFNLPNRFEGGQTALSMRLPKLPGFKSQRDKPAIVFLTDISACYKANEEVSIKSLCEKGLIKKNVRRAKVLNNGKLTVAVKFAEDIKISQSIKIPTPEVKKETSAIKLTEKTTKIETPSKKPTSKKTK